MLIVTKSLNVNNFFNELQTILLLLKKRFTLFTTTSFFSNANFFNISAFSSENCSMILLFITIPHIKGLTLFTIFTIWKKLV